MCQYHNQHFNQFNDIGWLALIELIRSSLTLWPLASIHCGLTDSVTTFSHTFFSHTFFWHLISHTFCMFFLCFRVICRLYRNYVILLDETLLLLRLFKKMVVCCLFRPRPIRPDFSTKSAKTREKRVLLSHFGWLFTNHGIPVNLFGDIYSTIAGSVL